MNKPEVTESIISLLLVNISIFTLLVGVSAVEGLEKPEI